MAATTVKPWLAYCRSGKAYRGYSASETQHATIDGKTTLCGLKEIGGDVKDSPFTGKSGYDCQRCVKKLSAPPVAETFEAKVQRAADAMHKAEYGEPLDADTFSGEAMLKAARIALTAVGLNG